MARVRTRAKTSAKKKLAAITSSVLVAALLLGGAFAWTDFSQNFINRFHGSVDNDILLHDDFEPGVNKDVYVENTGSNEAIVRVRFDEFLQIGNKAVVGTDGKDKSTWVTHLFTKAPATSDGKCTDCVFVSHDYYTWYMTGNQKNYLHGVSEIDNITYPDADVGTTGRNGQKIDKTLDEAPIVMLSYYLANKAEVDTIASNGCWLLDTDGWAYWSKLLAPGIATNLLLDDVVLDQNNKPDDNFFYAINVILQATNKTEAYKFDEKGISPDGKKLVSGLSKTTSLSTIIGNIPVGKTFKADGVEWLVLKEDENGNKLIFALDIQASSKFTESGQGVYEGSLLQNAMTIEYSKLINLKQYAMRPNALVCETVDSAGPWTAPGYGISEFDIQPAAVTTCSNVAAGSMTKDICFALSASDFATYFVGDLGNYINFEVPEGAEINFPYWRLRSDTGTVSEMASWNNTNLIVDNNLKIAPVFINNDPLLDGTQFTLKTSLGIHPALWVHS